MNKILTILVSIFLGLSCCNEAPATVCVWTSTSSRVWSTTANWSNGVPTAADIAQFNTKGTKVNPLVDQASVSVSGFQFTDSSAWTIDSSTSLRTNVVVGADGISVSNGTVTFNCTLTNLVDNIWTNLGTVTCANWIRGTGKISKWGTGNLLLSTSNDFSGGFDMHEGQVTAGNNLSFGTGLINVYSGSVVNAGVSIKTITNSLSVLGSCIMGSTSASFGLVWVGPTYFCTCNPVIGRHTTAAPITFGGLITGGGFVASNATSTITITNNVNTFTGGVSVVAGTLNVGTNQCLGTGTLSLYGGVICGTAGSYVPAITNEVDLYTGSGTITLTGSAQNQSYFGPVVLKGSVTINAASSRTALIGGTITDNGLGYNLTNSSVGSLTLSNSVMAGSVVQAAGTLNIGSPTALSTNVFYINAGTVNNTYGSLFSLPNPMVWSNFTYGSTMSMNMTNTITLSTNVTVTVSQAAGILAVGGAISDGVNTFNLGKSGTGELILSGANTYKGTTAIGQGTLATYSLNNIASPLASSSLGAPTTVANGTIMIGSGAILRYLGLGETSDRKLGSSSGICNIRNDSTNGALNFTGGLVSNLSSTVALAFGGSNTLMNSVDFTGYANVQKSTDAAYVSPWRFYGDNLNTNYSQSWGGIMQIDGTWACQRMKMDTPPGGAILSGNGSASNMYVSMERTTQYIRPGTSTWKPELPPTNPTNKVGTLTVGTCYFYNDINRLLKKLVTDFGPGSNSLLNVNGDFGFIYTEITQLPGIAHIFYQQDSTNTFGTPGTYNLVKYSGNITLNPNRCTIINPAPDVAYSFGYTASSNGYLYANISDTTWTGLGGDNLWTTAANWTGNTVPATNSATIFNRAITKNIINDNLPGTDIFSWTFTTNSGSFTLSGNSFHTGDIYNNSTNPVIFNVPLTLNGGVNDNILWFKSGSGSHLQLNSNIQQSVDGTYLYLQGTTTLSGSNNVSVYKMNNSATININNDYALGTNTFINQNFCTYDNTSPNPVVTPATILMGRPSFQLFPGTSPLTFSGPVSMYEDFAGDTHSFNVTNTLTYTGVISSTKKKYISKIGTGKLRLTNSNTFTGGVIVVEGTVQVDGSLPLLCPVTNGVSGTFGGSGVINSVTTNAGTIAPGSSVGVITFATNLVMLNNSAINWEIGLTTNDMISVLGNLTLGASTTLRVLNGGFSGLPNGIFVVMSYSGSDPVLGTWTVDTSGSPWSGATTSVSLDTATKRILLNLVAGSSGTTWSLYRQNSAFRKNSAIKSQGGN